MPPGHGVWEQRQCVFVCTGTSTALPRSGLNLAEIPQRGLCGVGAAHAVRAESRWRGRRTDIHTGNPNSARRQGDTWPEGQPAAAAYRQEKSRRLVSDESQRSALIDSLLHGRVYGQSSL